MLKTNSDGTREGVLRFRTAELYRSARRKHNTRTHLRTRARGSYVQYFAAPNIPQADISSVLLTESRSLSIFQYRAAGTILFNKMEIGSPGRGWGRGRGGEEDRLARAFEYVQRLNSHNAGSI